MEHRDRDGVITLYVADEAFVPGGLVSLGSSVAHHLRVRRLEVGAKVSMVDGVGHRALGTLVRLAPAMTVEVERLSVTPPPPPVHLLAPIADKDRMLWLAEKAAELGVATWRPILYRRSKSVKPRGEGPSFAGRIRARMAAALEQSGGEWLPTLYPEATLARVLPALPANGSRILLDAGGDVDPPMAPTAPVIVAVGPEGGLEPDERDLFLAQGFHPMRIGGNILRFETAAIAGLALARVALDGRSHGE